MSKNETFTAIQSGERFSHCEDVIEYIVSRFLDGLDEEELIEAIYDGVIDIGQEIQSSNLHSIYKDLYNELAVAHCRELIRPKR